jgi:flagellar protein FlgJ
MLIKEKKMNIGTVGAQYFEQYRYDTGNISPPRSRDPNAGGPSFADYLNSGRTELNNKTTAGREEAEAALKPGKPVIDKTGKLYEQCQELETFLVKNLLTGMRKTVQKSGLIEEGLAGQFYEDMLWDEYAASFSRNAGFGLADQAYLELTGQRGIRRPAAD